MAAMARAAIALEASEETPNGGDKDIDSSNQALEPLLRVNPGGVERVGCRRRTSFVEGNRGEDQGSSDKQCSPKKYHDDSDLHSRHMMSTESEEEDACEEMYRYESLSPEQLHPLGNVHRDDSSWATTWPFFPRRFVLAGGYVGAKSLDCTHVLDEDLECFWPGPDMGTGRCACATTMVDSSRMLVAGGHEDGHILDSTEILDLDAMLVAPGPKMMIPRSGSAVVMLDPDRIIVLGGSDRNESFNSTEILDVPTMTFFPGPVMGERRCGCAAAMLDVGRLLVAGGRNCGQFLDSTEILDLATMTFSNGPQLLSPRMACGAVLIDAERLLVVGGFDGTKCLSSTEVLATCEAAPAFNPGPSMTLDRIVRQAMLLGLDRLMVAGGSTGNCHDDTTEVMELSDMAFEIGPAPSVLAGMMTYKFNPKQDHEDITCAGSCVGSCSQGPACTGCGMQ